MNILGYTLAAWFAINIAFVAFMSFAAKRRRRQAEIFILDDFRAAGR